jgi:eukaryotic-like serine/threonine-protein kinase
MSDDKATWDFHEGDEIVPGRSVLKLLGGGNRYEAFLAWDEKLHTIVVAKVLRPDQVQDERALKELRKEAEALERFAHPVLVRGFGAVVEGARPHLVLEHLEGPTLRRLLKKYGPLPLEQLLPLGLHVSAALHYLSTEGIVHLDVKPSNIVMGAPPRLIDMSIWRTQESARKSSGGMGTRLYMAPEQCDPKTWGEIGPPADVWGIGVTLYEALTGKRPFSSSKLKDELGDDPDAASDSPVRKYPQLTQEPAPFPKNVPEPLREMILRTLSKKQDGRPSAAELAVFLEEPTARVPRPRLRRARPKLA